MDNNEVKVVEGAFLESLKRNNSKIKSDRATAKLAASCPQCRSKTY